MHSILIVFLLGRLNVLKNKRQASKIQIMIHEGLGRQKIFLRENFMLLVSLK